MMDQVFLLLLAMFGFVALICIGGLVAWLCGCDLNEPEYYAHRRTDEAD